MDFSIDNLNKFIETKLTCTVGNKLLTFFLTAYSDEGYYNENTFVPWADRKNNKSEKPLLYNTGKMKQGFHLSYKGDVIVIENIVPYSKYHQEGTSKMVARPFLYDGAKVNKVIEDVVLAELDKYFKK